MIPISLSVNKMMNILDIKFLCKNDIYAHCNCKVREEIRDNTKYLILMCVVFVFYTICLLYYRNELTNFCYFYFPITKTLDDYRCAQYAKLLIWIQKTLNLC